MTKKDNGLKTGVPAPVVTMVVPVWNQLDFTKRLVESIKRYVHLPYKIVFIDNGSSDGTALYLKSLQTVNPDRIEVVWNHSNRGFAVATNQGLAKCEGHMLWLNNDVEILRPGSIETLVQILESDPSLGAIGPVTDACMGPQQVGQNTIYPEFHPSRFLIGFMMLVREDCWKKVGKLEEGYNDAGQDDLDYSMRIRKAGYNIGICRKVLVHHFGGATQQMRYDQYGPKYKEMEDIGRQLLIQKWGKDAVDELFLPVDFSGIRVMVSIPAWGDIQPEAYINHVGTLMRESRFSEKTKIELEFAPMIRSAICCARNELVRQAIKRECTHLFFMDDDMVMPDHAIHKLVRRNVPIVSGLCYLRTPPHFPSMFIDPKDGTGKIFFIKNWPRKQMIQVDAVGSACVLIKTEVFKKIQEMEFPGDQVKCPECNHIWMPRPTKYAGEDLWYLYGKARPGEHTVGEDVFFTKLARDSGYPIMVDTSVVFGHIGPPIVYDEEYFERMKGEQRDFPGIEYTDYESACRIAGQPGGLLTPEDLAARLGGDSADRAAFFKRLYAGPIGDGKHPGGASAAGNKQEPGAKIPCPV